MPRMSPVRRHCLGCSHSSRSPPAAAAFRSDSRLSCRVRTASSTGTCQAQGRRECLACASAASAPRSSSSMPLCVPPSRQARPYTSCTSSSWPWISAGTASATSSSSRSGSSAARGAPGHSTARTPPASRAGTGAVVPDRVWTAACSRSATQASSASPVSKPSASLTTPRRATSISTTDNGCTDAPSNMRRSRVRLGKPVSGSL